MTVNRETLSHLRSFLHDARRTLDRARPEGGTHRQTLAALLAEADALAGGASHLVPRSIGVLRHVACSGGSLISRAVGLAANTLLLSEVDPFSDIGVDPMVQLFSPSDVIKLARNHVRPVDDRTVADMFVAAIQVLHRDLGLNGRSLVLRDHTHSRFFTETVDERPSVVDLAARIAPTRVVVTVRHPMESFISLKSNQWIMFDPPNISEYSRRYLEFLEIEADTPIFKYEDFVADPRASLGEILEALGIDAPCSELDLLDVIKVTGDSGRSGDTIAPRAPKAAPPDLYEVAAKDPEYRRLCERLEYSGLPVK